MGGGDVGRVPIVVREHAAPHRIYEYRIVLKPHLGTGLGDQLVDDAVSATWTIVCGARMRLAAARKFGIHSLLFNDAHLTLLLNTYHNPSTSLML